MYRASKQVKVSMLYDDIILLNIHTGEYISFNKTGQLFWKVLINTENEDEALQNLSNQIDAPVDTLKTSLYKFRDELIGAHLIEKS